MKQTSKPANQARAATLALLASLGMLMAAPAAAQPASTTNGEILFRQRCGACHSAAPGARSALGPNLAGVVGRPAASVEGYAYSPALRASGLAWNPATLDRFLAAPTTIVRGTRMSMPLPSATDRQAIIAYLATTAR